MMTYVYPIDQKVYLLGLVRMGDSSSTDYDVAIHVVIYSEFAADFLTAAGICNKA